MKRRWNGLKDWLDHRTGVQTAVRNFLYEDIPASSGWHQVFGSVAVFLFLTQAFTGALLRGGDFASPLRNSVTQPADVERETRGRQRRVDVYRHIHESIHPRLNIEVAVKVLPYHLVEKDPLLALCLSKRDRRIPPPHFYRDASHQESPSHTQRYSSQRGRRSSG